MKIKNWIEKNCKRLDGKTVLITGSTGVLGVEICKVLADLGANLILANRNEKLTFQQKAELEKIFPSAKIESVKLDMLDIESVKNASEKLKDAKIDIVILNAGAYKMPREKSTSGFDKVFQINFVSPYLFAKLLVPALDKSENPIVVDVGSIAHKKTKLNEADLDYSNCKNSQKVYGNAKRLLMLALGELFNKTKVKYRVAHPGVTPTKITRNYSKMLNVIIKYPMKVIFTSPKKACLNIVYALFVDCTTFEWIGPRVADVWGYPKKKPLKTFTLEERKRAFEIAEKILNNQQI